MAKSSVSIWVEDVQLTKKQIRFLAHKTFLKDIIRKRVETRLRNERARRQKIIEAHKKLLAKIKISPTNLLILGSALYWAEGGKSDRHRLFRFSNSDPEMIKVMMSFLRNTCDVAEERFRGHIHIHPHLNAAVAEKHWSKITKIPLNQFYKTSQSHNKRSSNTRDNLPCGTFNIEICSVDLYLKMLAWISAIKDKVLNIYG